MASAEFTVSVREKVVHLILIGLIMVGWFAWTGVSVMRAHTSMSDYSRAPVCSAATGYGAEATGDCRVVENGTIVSSTDIGGHAQRYSMVVALDSSDVEIGLSGNSAMLAYADPGNPATVTTWRGNPVTVSDAAGTASTSDLPSTVFGHDLGLLVVGEAIAFLVLSVLAWSLYRKHWRTWRARPDRRTSSSSASRPSASN